MKNKKVKSNTINLSDYPLVSIGMPVYNSELTIHKAIKSIVSQDYKNIELIISDNASTDETEKICRSLAKKDARIKYFRNKQNIGPLLNFQFVLKESKGDYFMWAAGDDIRTLGFISANLEVLLHQPGIVASCSPNVMGWKFSPNSKIIRFGLLGDKKTRFEVFFKNAYNSHALFYSLIRSEVIKRYPFPENAFWALDWHIVLFLASYGEINRTNSELTMFGTKGISSNQKNAYQVVGVTGLARILPFLFFSQRTFTLLKDWPKKDSIPLYFQIIKLNMRFVLLEYNNIKSYLAGLKARCFIVRRGETKPL